MTLKTRTKHILAAPAALAIAASGLVVGTATPAAADTCTPVVGCGELYNNSKETVTAAGGSKDDTSGWCWNGNAPRYSSPGTNPFNCRVNVDEVKPGEDTWNDHFLDADSFRVDAGCKVTFTRSQGSPLGDDAWPAPASHEYVEDRRGKAKDKWIKIRDNDTITIESQTCKGTPEKYSVETWREGNGYQDPYCKGDGEDWARCKSDGDLGVARNYFFCKQLGESIGTTFEYNHWWLLTDLDKVHDGRDGRAWVPAYNLTGDGNADNNTANYYDKDAGEWKEIPDC